MRQTLAFFNYYVKMLSKDKISLFWTILFPLVLSLITYLPLQNQFETNTQKLEFLYVYWAFSIVMIFVNGVGSYFATIRQTRFIKNVLFHFRKETPICIIDYYRTAHCRINFVDSVDGRYGLHIRCIFTSNIYQYVALLYRHRPISTCVFNHRIYSCES